MSHTYIRVQALLRLEVEHVKVSKFSQISSTYRIIVFITVYFINVKIGIVRMPTRKKRSNSSAIRKISDKISARPKVVTSRMILYFSAWKFTTTYQSIIKHKYIHISMYIHIYIYTDLHANATDKIWISLEAVLVSTTELSCVLKALSANTVIPTVMMITLIMR